jgi:hypothetical protein
MGDSGWTDAGMSDDLSNWEIWLLIGSGKLNAAILWIGYLLAGGTLKIADK